MDSSREIAPAAPPEFAALDSVARRHVSPCGDGEMVWREWGYGVPVVLLHGGYGSWGHWLRNIGPLARRHRVIAPDLPGLGESAAPPPTENLDDVSDIVHDGLMTVLGQEEHFHLVGFSFGGHLSGRISARAGDRLLSLTLVGAGGLGLPRIGRAGGGLARVERGMSPAEIDALQRENLAKMMFHDPARIDDIAVWLQIENVRRGRFKSIPFARGTWLAQALPAIVAPIAGIWGEFDGTAYPHLDQRAALLRQFQPEAPFHVVAGAGHWVQYEAAAEFNRLLRQFLDRN
jgi:pimeloyl-ACP methyl ester carboxylesterase